MPASGTSSTSASSATAVRPTHISPGTSWSSATSRAAADFRGGPQRCHHRIDLFVLRGASRGRARSGTRLSAYAVFELEAWSPGPDPTVALHDTILTRTIALTSFKDCAAPGCRFPTAEGSSDVTVLTVDQSSWSMAPDIACRGSRGACGLRERAHQQIGSAY